MEIHNDSRAASDEQSMEVVSTARNGQNKDLTMHDHIKVDGKMITDTPFFAMEKI